jgi:hypothetical protein
VNSQHLEGRFNLLRLSNPTHRESKEGAMPSSADVRVCAHQDGHPIHASSSFCAHQHGHPIHVSSSTHGIFNGCFRNMRISSQPPQPSTFYEFSVYSHDCVHPLQLNTDKSNRIYFLNWTRFSFSGRSPMCQWSLNITTKKERLFDRARFRIIAS